MSSILRRLWERRLMVWLRRLRWAGLYLVWLAVCVVGTPTAWAAGTGGLPNIVFIYADDLGYGDIGCYGATRVRTPNLDRLAREGLRFTDAHSSAATCTPSRYAVMTGEYAWRRKGTGVLPGDAAALLAPGRTTLASMLRQAGYATGVVGKWHLGLGGGPGRTDWNGEVRPGPLEVGFDSAFLMPATGDRVPCVYVEDRRVVGLESADPLRVSFAGPVGDEPTGRAHPELLRVVPSHGHDMTIVRGISRIGYMSGGRSAWWKDEDMADEFTRRAVAFIERNRERRFFLYLAPHSIHVPRVPHPRHVGSTEMGPRGDVIVELDDGVGRVLEALDRWQLADDTLVIFSSDNGPVVDDGYRDEAVARLGDHRPSGPWRGGKYSAFEGGTRVPMLVRWPRRVRPGVTDALVCHVDLLASLASLTGQKLAEEDGPDSMDVLGALLGEARVGRETLVLQAGTMALRRGTWKYIEPSKQVRRLLETNIETGADPEGLLFDLADDPGETRSVLQAEPERARRMAEELARQRAATRTRP